MDHNVYDGTPTYEFVDPAGGLTTCDLRRIRARGFERQARVVATAWDLFADRTSFRLKPMWQTAGRDGGPVGPRFPIARLRDAGRYGPGALHPWEAARVIEQPTGQEMTAGGTARFAVRIQGPALSYQWQRSHDGGPRGSTSTGRTPRP